MSVKQFMWKSVKGHTDRIKTFGSWLYEGTKQPALCQITGCKKAAKWAVGFKGRLIILCFAHGEDC